MTDRATERAIAMWDDGARWDEILGTLRGEGSSKVECIRATVEILRLPLPDAKRIVHESRAWADRRDDDDQFHDALEAEFRAERPAADSPPGPRHRSLWHGCGTAETKTGSCVRARNSKKPR